MFSLRFARRYFSTSRVRKSDAQIHTEESLIKRKFKLSSNLIISVIKNDITAEEVDIIVNPSFSGLKHHEGISSHIVAMGGNKIQEQCNEIVRYTGKLERGLVASTSAGSLPAKYIFHASAPFYAGNPNLEASMGLVVQNCLRKVNTVKCNSIAIPILVKYIDYPREEAAEHMIKGVLDWCESNKNTQPLDIRFVNLEDDVVDEFVKGLDRKLGYSNEGGYLQIRIYLFTHHRRLWALLMVKTIAH